MNEQLVRALMDRFAVLAETCARFSQEVYRRTGVLPEANLPGTVRRNLDISRTVFTEWAIDILVVIYFRGIIDFGELRETLRIKAPVLARKLRDLEYLGLVQRSVAGKRPQESRYSLTHKGSVITRLGEPVFLYLRLASGWFEPANSPAAYEPVARARERSSPVADESLAIRSARPDKSL